MKRIFNKTSNSPATDQSDESGHQARTAGSRHDERAEHKRLGPNQAPPAFASSPNSRQDASALHTSASRGELSSGMLQSARRPLSSGGTGGAYPSYGEVHRDPKDSRSGNAIMHSGKAAHGMGSNGAATHQQPPSRPHGSQPWREGHARSRSSNQAHSNPDASPPLPQGVQWGNSPPGQAEYRPSEPLFNPHGNPTGSLSRERRSSKSQGGTMSRIRSISRRGSQSQGYSEERATRPSRSPSLSFGIESGWQGGQTVPAAGFANGREGEMNEMASGDGSVVRPESRYVDRHAETRPAQSAAIGVGMDKVKRKLFGRKKRDERGEEEERDRKSSEEWIKAEYPGPMEMPGPAARSAGVVEGAEKSRGEHVPAHSPWFSAARHHSKPGESMVSSQIGTLCIQDEEEWDWNQVITLCNSISHSETASKEAARALRKEFKYGEEVPKYRAIRLWAIVCIRASDRFRLQVATKKFLEVLEDLYTDKRTSTAIRGRLLLAWSMLAHEFQLDQDLHPICKVFNKIKPNDMPLNGVALDVQNELFNQSRSVYGQEQDNRADMSHDQDIYNDYHSSQPRTMDQQHEGSGQPTQTATTTTVVRTTSVSNRTRATEADQQLPRLSDDIRRLHEECHVARGNAQLMAESLIEHGLQSELVTEFAGKTQSSQDFILAQIPWASAQVDRSRMERQARMMDGQGEGEDGGRKTREEELMEDLLETHEKLIAANGMVKEARDREQEEEEERQAIDRSMREQRIDRSTLFQDASTGHFYSGGSAGAGLAPPTMEAARASSSRSASPAPYPVPSAHTSGVLRRPLPVPDGLFDSTAMQKSHSTPSHIPSASQQTLQHNAAMLAAHAGSADDALRPTAHRGGPRPMDEVTPLTVHRRDDMEENNAATAATSTENTSDDDSLITTPIAPSAKALGKRRAMSINDDQSQDDDGDAGNRHLASQMGGMHLQQQAPNPKEERLRARPPPALPNIPPPSQDESSTLPSTNPFHRFTQPSNNTNPFRT